VQALHVAQAGSGLQQCIGQALLTLLHLLHQLGICLSSSIAHCLLQLFFLHSKHMVGSTLTCLASAFLTGVGLWSLLRHSLSALLHFCTSVAAVWGTALLSACYLLLLFKGLILEAFVALPCGIE